MEAFYNRLQRKQAQAVHVKASLHVHRQLHQQMNSIKNKGSILIYNI